MKLPLVYKLILFYIVEDFGLYWVHRLMHTNHFWRTHRWHQYPNYMYWLVGVRTSIPDIFLFNVTFVFARPLLSGAPLWLFQLSVLEHILRNYWMHMNVSWNSHWLEYLVVTPRYRHVHVHHSNDPAHYRNLGSLLTVWDRIFATCTDPGNVKKALSFGIGHGSLPIVSFSACSLRIEVA
jgi:sterol desaturase/sphingolipid hydroxylase (fatty acid hydroxylase superfamily)